jgi:HD-GYP domain-containing protein (c-di-GMP phosphodiesterase class II)
VYGREILAPIRFFEPVIPGVHLHHERWDGKGYPLGIGRAEIPLCARIIAVADTYDAMTSDRAYRTAVPHATTLREIRRCAGNQLDPEVADVFAGNIDQFLEERQERGVTH